MVGKFETKRRDFRAVYRIYSNLTSAMIHLKTGLILFVPWNTTFNRLYHDFPNIKQ